MTKSAKLNKILSIAVSIAAVALSAYSPGTALAGTNEVSYNYYKQSTAGEYIDSVFSDETRNDFGIASYGGGFNRDNADGLFDTSSKYQKNNSKASTHVVYNVEPETEFSADFAIISVSEMKGYIQKKDFTMEIQGWDSLNEKWNSITELSFSKDSYDETKKNYSVVITEDIDICYNCGVFDCCNRFFRSGGCKCQSVHFKYFGLYISFRLCSSAGRSAYDKQMRRQRTKRSCRQTF